MNDSKLDPVRRAYAKQILAEAGVSDRSLEQAFATLRREDFVGPGPWKLFRFPDGYYETPSDDPVYLYQDKLCALNSDKGLNNGQPSFLCFLISLGRLNPGDRVVHVGAGVGYYTAIMAEVVGNTGHVCAVEFEKDLASRAKNNLAGYCYVDVMQGDGSLIAFDPADVILVNAGATRPANVWLDALKDGGRLVLPLTVSFTTDDGHAMTKGAIFLIQRNGKYFSATWVSPTQIYPCMGLRDAESEAALVAGFKGGGWKNVRRLHRSDDIPKDECWVKTTDWSLTYH
ncbi:MAG: hypothetical protein RIC29_16520 [Rhodospirillaceae bacterium]